MIYKSIAEVVEVWKTNKYDKRYEISSMGRSRFIPNGRISIGYVSKRNGYTYFKLGQKVVTMARQVAIHFIPNPENKPEVNHKGPKGNNTMRMLEWATKPENGKHACDHIKRPHQVFVNKVDLVSGEVVKTYSNYEDIVKDGYNRKYVSTAIGRKQKYAGYRWEHAEDPKTRDSDPMYADEVWVWLKDSIYDEVNIFVKYQVSNFARVKGWFGNISTSAPKDGEPVHTNLTHHETGEKGDS